MHFIKTHNYGEHMNTAKAATTGCARYAILLLLAGFLLLAVAQTETKAALMPVPDDLSAKGISAGSAPEDVLSSLLGIPYREDGAVDERGRYTLFADPAKKFNTPGLNCSGLVLEASRFLLKKNFTLEEAKRDRLGDSGPGSPHGEDWDFGWDLVMNLSEGFSRVILLPGNKTQDPATATGFAPRGYDLHSDETWKELPGRLRRGYLYLVSMNVEGRRKGYALVHYHVGLIHVDNTGKAWFYQTTGKGKVANRRDLSIESGRASLKQAFANRADQRRMMVVLEVALPQKSR